MYFLIDMKPVLIYNNSTPRYATSDTHAVRACTTRYTQRDENVPYGMKRPITQTSTTLTNKYHRISQCYNKRNNYTVRAQNRNKPDKMSLRGNNDVAIQSCSLMQENGRFVVKYCSWRDGTLMSSSVLIQPWKCAVYEHVRYSHVWGIQVLVRLLLLTPFCLVSAHAQKVTTSGSRRLARCSCGSLGCRTARCCCDRSRGCHVTARTWQHSDA